MHILCMHHIYAASQTWFVLIVFFNEPVDTNCH